MDSPRVPLLHRLAHPSSHLVGVDLVQPHVPHKRVELVVLLDLHTAARLTLPVAHHEPLATTDFAGRHCFNPLNSRSFALSSDITCHTIQVPSACFRDRPWS